MTLDRQPARPSFAAVVATLVVGLLTLRALAHPLLLYDDWWYHLPFASFLYGIGGGRDAYHASALIDERWRGFPKFWEVVQGFMWWATGSLRPIAGPQVALVYAYVYGVSREFEIPPSWTWLAFLASPLIVIHFAAAYNDLPAAIGVAAGALLFMRMIADASTGACETPSPSMAEGRVGGETPEPSGARPPPPPLPHEGGGSSGGVIQSLESLSRARAALAVAGFALAGAIKYQGLVAVVAVSVALAVLAFFARRKRAKIFALIVFANVAAGAPALENLAEYGNPLYPIEVKAFGHTIFAGPESADYDAGIPAYATPSGAPANLPEPVNFVLSATELDFSLRGVPPRYNIDAVAGRTPASGAPARTGGWGAMFVIANATLLVVQILRRREESGPAQRLYALGALLIVVTAALLPRAHELRYWLYVPLVVGAVNLRFLARSGGRDLAAAGLVALALYSTAQCLMSPKSELMLFRPIDAAGLAAARPPDVVEALNKAGRFCAGAEDDLPFLVSSAVTRQPGFVSNRAEDCR